MEGFRSNPFYDLGSRKSIAADIVPSSRGEIDFTYYGLDRIKIQSRPGLQALMVKSNFGERVGISDTCFSNRSLGSMPQKIRACQKLPVELFRVPRSWISRWSGQN